VAAAWGILSALAACGSPSGGKPTFTGGASGAASTDSGQSGGSGGNGGSGMSGERPTEDGAAASSDRAPDDAGAAPDRSPDSPAATTDGGVTGTEGGPASDSNPSAPSDLTVGDRLRPMNVEGVPLFGWLPHDGPHEIQSAYQIVVTRKTDGTMVWDSGKVPSSDQSYVPFAGPSLTGQTSYSWSIRTWDRDDQPSPWATPAEFDTGVADADWAASWIRRASTEPDDYTLARKELAVAASPVTRARVYISANHQYELHLNGATVDRGQAFSYPGEGYYQATDVTAAVPAGAPLALGVITHWYGPGQGRPAGERGLLLRLVVEHADGSRQVVVTDGTWRVTRATTWQTGAPLRNSDSGDYVERMDGRQSNPGWDRPGYDASAAPWMAPQVIGMHPAGVFTHLVGHEPRITSTRSAPVSIRTLSDGSVVADFGKVIPARPMVHFAAGVSGRALTILIGYRLLADGHVSEAVATTQGTNMSFAYTQAAGAQDFSAFTHLAWRYLQISAPGETLAAGAVAALVEHTDVQLDRTATFESSDPTLNAVFALLQRSALYSVGSQFVDTPTREKGQFLADAVNQSFATMSGYGERDSTQKALAEFSRSQTRYWPDGQMNAVYPNGDGKRDIPDFTEMYAGWVWRYYLLTGDRATLARLYPVMVNIASYVWSYRNATTGLVTNLAGGSGDYLYGIVDWPPSSRYGYDMAVVARTTVNMLAVDVMQNAANAAQALGRPASESQLQRQRATDLTAAINARLRRADGIYVDGLTAAGTQSAVASQHSSSFAIAYRIAPAADHAALARYIAGLGMKQGPMTAHWLLKALGDADATDAVVTRLTDAVGPGWSNILASGGTFTWESWTALADAISESHGWGSQAVDDFVETLLGVRVTVPGAAEIAIVIPRTTLAFARGVVPTQRGPVAVDWRRATNGSLSVTVNVPVNVRAQVSLPVIATSRPSATGEGAPSSRGVENSRVTYDIGSGRSLFTVE
jgi:alpha-L-rhamnosidase